MKKIKIVVVFILWVPFISFANDWPEIDKRKAENCNTCHSPVDKVNNSSKANQPGKLDEYLIKQLQKKESGSRIDLLRASQTSLSLTEQ